MDIVRSSAMHSRVGVLGCVIAIVELLALFSGRVRLDVQGFGALFLGLAIWFVAAGWELRGRGRDLGPSR
ncbi:MAG: hypothetical protein GEU90_20720 [Gemmatimonas sp.]|nr:hypothetical protein [Gemmatimonas sp.]